MKPKEIEPILALKANPKTSENIKKVHYNSIVRKFVVHFCNKIKLLVLAMTISLLRVLIV